MSYITPRARDLLNLKTVEKREMSIKPFKGARENKTLDLVKLWVKTDDPDLNIYVQVFVTEICYPVSNQNIKQAQLNQLFLEVSPAESNQDSLPMDVDILIGADFYWTFMNNHVKQDKAGGANAM